MFAVFPLIFYVVFLLCCSSSCVHYVPSFSGLSMFDCPFRILLRVLYQCYKPDQVILNTTWDDLYSVLDLIISYCDLVVTRNCHACVLSLELLTISGSDEGYSSNA